MAKKGSKKSFEMNDDYGLDVLDVFGLTPEMIAYAEQPDPAPEPTEGELPMLTEQAEAVFQKLSGGRPGGQVYFVDVSQLEPYPDQPFQQYPIERLQELADDIARVGILSPILTRRRGHRLQILAGHNRWDAAKLAGLNEVPVMVLNVDDDQAILVLTSTNLRQRERLLPSEKAFAYKMQMDALKRQGQRGGGEAYNAAAAITKQTGDSRMQIHRYIRLTELIPELLAMLDREKISMTPAVSVSYLNHDDQYEVLGLLQQYSLTLTIERAAALKKASEEAVGAIRPEVIQDLMLQLGRKKAEPGYVRISFERIQRYLPEGIGEDEVEEWLMGVLARAN